MGIKIFEEYFNIENLYLTDVTWRLYNVESDVAKELLQHNTIHFKDLSYDNTGLFFWCYKYSNRNLSTQCLVAVDTKTYLISAIRFTRPSTPTSDEIAELVYRISCLINEQCRLKRVSNSHKIKKICFVGGIDCDFKSDSSDASRLRNTIRYCLDSGIDIDPNFTVDVVNLCDGRDFLKEKSHYDMVILGYIFKYDGNNTDVTLPRKDYEGASTINSNIHSLQKWTDRIEATGAKIVVTYGGVRSEVTVNDLDKAMSLSILMPAADIHAPNYNPNALDNPFMSAFALNKSYLKLIKSQLSKTDNAFNTALARSILDSNLDLKATLGDTDSNKNNFCGFRTGFLL